ncbi:hypothetical protein [Baekduia sp. Peel2402]|uniref:hypothetical protein n=1 Tax=Baekduia sp. Peel2402 TaxID=3458296 RepID=UPI00403E9BAA
MRRRLALGLLVALVAAAAPAAARAELGISDAGPGIFTDWRFTDLGVRHVRLVVPWDVALNGSERTDRYLRAAQAAGVDVHVAFEHSAVDRCPSAPCALPTAAAYREAFAAFRARWPLVRGFTTWNEASHPTQPTARAPARVAEYLRVLIDGCPGCELVGPDVLDADPGVTAWLAAFRAAAGAQTGIWGLHDYGDPNGTATIGIDAFVAAAAGAPVWLTEIGGIVRFRTDDGVETMGYDEARAARAIGFALALVDAYTGPVTRAYLHSFTGGGRMDTGLVGPDGATRPGYDVVLNWLRAHEVPPLPRPPGQEKAKAPIWDLRGGVDPKTGQTTGDGAALIGASRAPKRLVLRSPRARRVGRRGARLLLSCAAGAPRCRGHVLARGCRPAAFSIAPGRRATLLLHCARPVRRGEKLALTVTQAGVKTWHAKVAVR